MRSFEPRITLAPARVLWSDGTGNRSPASRWRYKQQLKQQDAKLENYNFFLSGFAVKAPNLARSRPSSVHVAESLQFFP